MQSPLIEAACWKRPRISASARSIYLAEPWSYGGPARQNSHLSAGFPRPGLLF